MIALIDYKAGNLTSVRKALAAVGADVYTPDRPGELDKALGVIVPGVGHFTATKAITGAWTEAILARVGEGCPLLGICLGMQWLYEGSEEDPGLKGLGLLGGSCRRIRPPGDQARIKVPHVGWNSLDRLGEGSIARDIPEGAQVYFTHSYAAPITAHTVAITTHGEPFASIVQRGQVAGVQFHPEKSGEIGLTVLRNFRRMVG